MNKAYKTATALLLAAVFLTLYIKAAKASDLLGYQEPEAHGQEEVVLYFRYDNSAYLEQETRVLSLMATQGLEKALVQALLDGPAASGLHSLFPEGTQVVSVLPEGSRLFVTLSGDVMKAMPNENITSEQGKQAAILRRTLAMAALVNTLTERGAYQSVQVLVINQPGLSNSLRLSQRYYLQNDDSIPPPLTRMEEAIITPGRAAAHMLSLWQNQNLRGFISHLTTRAQEGQDGQTLDTAALPLLKQFSTSQGSLAPDHSYALVMADLVLTLRDGQETTVSAFPLVLNRSQGVWTLSLPSILKLLQEAGV